MLHATYQHHALIGEEHVHADTEERRIIMGQIYIIFIISYNLYFFDIHIHANYKHTAHCIYRYT
jgi:hypothetical protein